MSNRQSAIREASRLGNWMLRELGREVRVARLMSGATQAQIGATLGLSASHVSRVENGLVKSLSLSALAMHAAAVGLKPWVALYPLVARPLDRPQLELLGRFRGRIGAMWEVTVEAAVPIKGDLRAADALLVGAGVRCMVEVITRLADFQAQLRAARRKQRDIGADHLIFVVAGTTTNRKALADAGAVVRDAFPLNTRETLAALAAGRGPGADGLVLI